MEIGEEILAGFQSRGLTHLDPADYDEHGEGPHQRLVLRGATLIDGTGAPPWGYVDLVIENGYIKDIISVGVPGLPIDAAKRPPTEGVEIDCEGRFITPGLIDSHAHIGAPFHAARGPLPSADYVYRLLLAHGITTIRDTGCFNGLAWTISEKNRAANHQIAAPNIHAYAYFPSSNDYYKSIYTPEQARAWVDRLAETSADGIKFFGAAPRVMRAALEQAQEKGLPTCCHHASLAVSRMNALTTAQWGLTSTEHFYGLPEALMTDTTVQSFPVGYHYNDEYLRFSAAGQTFAQAAVPGSSRWQEVLHEFVESGHTFVPTLSVYDANRDLMRVRRADWHDCYTHPTLLAYFDPHRGGHGAYWYRWTTADEVQWRQMYDRWMAFLADFKNLGGRVCAGSDPGFMYQVYGVGLVRELELLQEAGFNALEALRAATYDAAHLLGIEDETGSIEIGKRADLLVHDANPLDDFKQLYASGALRLDEQNQTGVMKRTLAITIKQGVVYRTADLLADVRERVERRSTDARIQRTRAAQ